MEDAEGVPTKGGVGLTMFEWGVLLRFAALGLLSGSGWFEGVIIEVLRRWREVPEESWGVEGVVAVSLVGG